MHFPMLMNLLRLLQPHLKNNQVQPRKWEKQLCLLVGDSINDLDAARVNGIDFIARDSGLENWNLIDNQTIIEDLSHLSLYLT